MKTKVGYGVMIFIAGSGLASVVWFSFHNWSADYQQNFFSNTLATSVGLIIGVPLGLLIDSLRSSGAKREIKSAQNKKREKVLSVIEKELKENLEVIPERIKDSLAPMTHPFSTESWDALSSSGELQYIEDPEILGELSSVYAKIRQVKYLEDQGVVIVKSVASSSDMKNIGGRSMLSSARSFNESLTEDINRILRTDNLF